MRSVWLTGSRYLLAAAALVGAYFSFVFARASLAFHEDTAESVATAARLVPFNGAYQARLAGWRPADKIALLRRAVELNPFDVQSWIQLGLTAEVEQHDANLAERYYLRAADVDHMFLPKWTLTNFYFRQQRADDFFHWANLTLAITPYAADPVFAQMWLMSQDSQRIARAIPDRASVLLGYASFLANAHQYQAVPPIVDRLVKTAGKGKPADFGRDDQIAPMEDRLLAAGDLESALAVWQSMRQANWVSLPTPTPQRPLNNGNFDVPFFKHGFDWAPIPINGVTLDHVASEKLVRITFSSDEPEYCALLRQYVPLAPNRAYRLSWQADAESMGAPSGLAWDLYTVADNAQTSLASGDLLEAKSGMWDFRSSGADLYLLKLEYKRPLGTVLATGAVTLRGVSLKER